MRQILKTLYFALAASVTILVFLLCLRLYFPDDAEYGSKHIGQDLLPELLFLKQALKGGAGQKMQRLFPEGYFFSHVLYGLAWVDVGLRLSFGDSLHRTALKEAKWAFAKLDTPTGRAPFSEALDPPFGVFYVGWSSRLLGGILQLQPLSKRAPAQVARFQDDCAKTARAFDSSSSPFLSAYPGQAWPVDSVVAMSALTLHDTLFLPRFESTRSRWLSAARARLDPDTGLLPHQVHPETGEPIQGARGSSQSVISRFLIEIDPKWGRAQYERFRRQFITSRLGMPGVREYPLGRDGPGDVDSGPLVLGFSASASVVAMGAAEVHGDREAAAALIHAIEAVGMPVYWGNTKRYAFGLMPVGDAFLVWSKAARLWNESPATAAPPRFSPIIDPSWRGRLLGAALILIALVWSPFALGRRRSRKERIAPKRA